MRYAPPERIKTFQQAQIPTGHVHEHVSQSLFEGDMAERLHQRGHRLVRAQKAEAVLASMQTPGS
jgi:hypothetical protein